MAKHMAYGASGMGDAGHSYDGAAREAEARKCASAVSAQKMMTPAGGYDSGRHDRNNNNMADYDPNGDFPAGGQAMKGGGMSYA